MRKERGIAAYGELVDFLVSFYARLCPVDSPPPRNPEADNVVRYYDIVEDTTLYREPVPPAELTQAEKEQYSKGYRRGWKHYGKMHYWCLTRDGRLLLYRTSGIPNVFEESPGYRMGFMAGRRRADDDIDIFDPQLRERLMREGKFEAATKPR